MVVLPLRFVKVYLQCLRFAVALCHIGKIEQGNEYF